MPREFIDSGCCLACHMKGLTLADARCPSLNNSEVGILKRRWRVDWRPYKSLGSMEQNRDVNVRDGGYVREGVGGGLTFICKDGVDGSSSLIPNLFTLNLVPQYSWFHQTIPNTPSSVLLLLCAICNSLFNCLTLSF